MVKKWGVVPIVSLLVGAAVAMGIALIGAAETNENTLDLILCGVVAIASMIVPGISGSYVLILLGNYRLIMIESVTSLSNGLKGTDWPKIKEALAVVVPVGIGCVVGIAVLSRFLSWLFKRFHDAAVALMTGFVAGSLLVIWPWKKRVPLLDDAGNTVKEDGGWERLLPDISQSQTQVAIGIMVAACAIVFVMEIFASRRGQS